MDQRATLVGQPVESHLYFKQISIATDSDGQTGATTAKEPEYHNDAIIRDYRKEI